MILEITDRLGILLTEDLPDDDALPEHILHPQVLAWLDEHKVAYRCYCERTEDLYHPFKDGYKLEPSVTWTMLVIKSFIEFKNDHDAMAFKLRWWSSEEA